MAYSNDETYQHLGSFGLLNGVMVKISDRFKPPKKICLPHDWFPSDPSDLLSYQYNFQKEEQAIQLAEEERLINQKQEIVEEPQYSEDDYENAEIDHQHNNIEASSEECNEQNPNNNQRERETEILTPSIVVNEKLNNQVQGNKFDINFEEFENQNQNPFEMVELQTLDEFDELRSVLEPKSVNNKKKVIRSKAESTTEDNLDLSIFTSVYPVTSYEDKNTVDTLVDTTSYDVPKTFDSNFKNGTLNWTKFDTECNSTYIPQYRSTNPFQPDPINQTDLNVSNIQYMSRSPPACSVNSYNAIIPNTTPPFSSLEYDLPSNGAASGLPRTKSLPNLQDQEDYENVEAFTRPRTTSRGDMRASFHKSSEQIQPSDANVPTGRIENIMKQYNFQRITEPTNTSQFSTNTDNVSTIDFAQNAHSPAVTVSAQQFMPQPLSTQHFVPQSNINTQQYVASPVVNTQQYMPQPAINAQQPFITSHSSPETNYPNASTHNNIGNYVPPYMNSLSHAPTMNSLTHVPTSIYSSATQSIPTNGPPLYQNTYGSSKSGPMLIQSQMNSSAQNHINISPGNQNISLPPQLPPSSNNLYGRGVLRPVLREHVQPINNFGSGDSNSAVFFGQQSSGAQIQNNSEGTISQPKPAFHQSPVASAETTHVNSWLVDQTHMLSTSEKNFAYQLSAMGFALPCVSRTIKRLGLDDKEVLDFLCLVQDLRDKGYASDDVEVALLNVENKEKVTDYLDMVATFKELGFPPKDIHEALKETSCDQNKALDYLTR